MDLELVLICVNAHITSADIINPVVHPDGTVDGYAGSSADYCNVCGLSGLTILETRAK